MPSQKQKRQKEAIRVLREYLTPIFEQIDYEAEMRNELLESELEVLTDVIDVLGIEIDLSEEEWLDAEKLYSNGDYGRNKEWWGDAFCEGLEEGYEVEAKSDTDIATETLSSLGYSKEEIEEMLGIK